MGKRTKRWGDETRAASVECRAAKRQREREREFRVQRHMTCKNKIPKHWNVPFWHLGMCVCHCLCVCVCDCVCVCVAGVRHVCVSKLNFTGKNLLYWFKEARDGGGIRLNYGRQSELWVAANKVLTVDAALTHTETVRLSLSLSVYHSPALSHIQAVLLSLSAQIFAKNGSWQFEVASSTLPAQHFRASF